MRLENKKAPDFELPDASGEVITLRQFTGTNVVLYFYPKDNTPGCTKEACDFQAAKGRFTRANAVIIGISPDSSSSHLNFSKKYGLKLILLADSERKVAKAYGVLKKKNMYGKQVLGIERSTFIIDTQGVVRHELRGVKVDGHIEGVLQLVKDLG